MQIGLVRPQCPNCGTPVPAARQLLNSFHIPGRPPRWACVQCGARLRLHPDRLPQLLVAACVIVAFMIAIYSVGYRWRALASPFAPIWVAMVYMVLLTLLVPGRPVVLKDADYDTWELTPAMVAAMFSAPVVVVGILYAARYAARTPWPPLPAELRKLECQITREPSVTVIRPEILRDKVPLAGHDFLEVAGTVVALPCTRQGSMDGAEEQWKRERDPNAMSAGLGFKKAPQGQFEVTADMYNSRPLSKNTRYAVEAYVRMHPAPPFQPPPQSRTVTVATPKAFSATGNETTFICSPTFASVAEVARACRASIRSNRLHWLVIVRFGWPFPADLDVPGELAEAYVLLAAHVVSQN